MVCVLLASTVLATSPSQATVPLPVPAPAQRQAVTAENAETAALRAAFAAIGRRDSAAYRDLAPRLAPLDRRIADWIALRRDLPGLTVDEIQRFGREAPAWPSADLVRRRAEAVLLRSRPGDAALIDAFSRQPPLSETGRLALARAHLAAGDREKAAAAFAPLWRGATFSLAQEPVLAKEFAAVLTRADHLARYRMLVYEDRLRQARIVATQLGADWSALTEARSSVVGRLPNGRRLLDALPVSVRTDPIAQISRVDLARRADDDVAAGRILAATVLTPEDDPDRWWIQRRIVSRSLLEEGNARLAYELAAAQRGGTALTRTEAAFHAGWYALRFLEDPARALGHFRQLSEISTRPISRSRAAYWLGRTHDALGDKAEARRHYERAAEDVTTFYGQIAATGLGRTRLDLPPAPEPTAADHEAFAANELVRAAQRLTALGRGSDAALLFTELARTLKSPGQIALLARLAEEGGAHRIALQVGKLAHDTHPEAVPLAFPLEAIPESARTGGAVEPAVVYAISRQESAFDPAAVSPAGALGLMQLLPGTARATAGKLGTGYATSRLTTDPAYNARLGAAHVRELADRFDGSYVLAFAAYNAGAGRAREWIARFGDPRDPAVDTVDWIEKIPFGETRNYVQRVMENLQVYRARLADAPLQITEDLAR
ncbi:lytic transglycosylase domain-containing protein [Methylobrevis pamukkalensis]|uniref:lytic transglycosylase domain-containing protein n=1 Tax=Methylobrevis pamukkalensis TaxID=1439726 RepID=UPI001FD9C13B|nr:lytic transglycosylase domain-containing protein [Methylobrevis pamukkalensis]